MRGGRHKSKPPVARVVLLISVAVVAVGGGVLYVFLQKPANAPPGNESTVVTVQQSIDVLVAMQNLDEGTELKPALFRKESRPAQDFAAMGAVGGFDQLPGAFAKSFVAAGQPLLSEHLTFRPPINSVVPQIRPGYRAITIKLDKQATNEGWARAGVRVDVMWAWKEGGMSQASIVAQNVRVLSSGTSVSSEFGGDSKIIHDGESTVTLEVSAEDQKRLKLASGRGELRLLLRGDEDTFEISDKTKISVDAIISSPQDPVQHVPADQGWVIIDSKKYRVVGSTLIPG